MIMNSDGENRGQDLSNRITTYPSIQYLDREITIL